MQRQALLQKKLCWREPKLYSRPRAPARTRESQSRPKRLPRPLHAGRGHQLKCARSGEKAQASRPSGMCCGRASDTGLRGHLLAGEMGYTAGFLCLIIFKAPFKNKTQQHNSSLDSRASVAVSRTCKIPRSCPQSLSAACAGDGSPAVTPLRGHL